MKLKTGFVLFQDYHQKANIGSSRIRGKWLIDKMKGAEEFVQGNKYDVIIFQKTYWKEMARQFKGVKILDICDPDWLDGAEVINFIEEMDAVVVPTEIMRKRLSGMTKVPIHIIPDRVNLETLPKLKVHKGRAKSCVWFGYIHNAHVLDGVGFKVKKNNLLLKIISNGTYNFKECSVKNIKWEQETVDAELRKADIALLPRMLKGRDEYKSNNKTIHSWAIGLPVATNPKELDLFMDEEERTKECKKRRKEVEEDYDVKLSVKEYETLIKDLIKNK